MFSQTYTWALKRVFKFFLKRTLGRILKNELNLQQLDVALGSGKLELRSVVLNTEYLAAQLGDASPLTVEEGYVGCIRAVIPWNALGSQPVVVGTMAEINPF